MVHTAHLFSDRGANPDKLESIIKALGWQVRRIQRQDLLSLPGSDATLLFFPGGWYALDTGQKAAVQAFVAGGGGCIGVCAGAYQVAGYIPLMPGRVLRANLRGRLYMEPQQGDHPILSHVVMPCTRHQDRRWEQVLLSHMGGPIILPEKREWIIGSYDCEGELGALTAAELGLGRAVAIASHPELALAPLSQDDSLSDVSPDSPRTCGDVRLILANAIRWAMRLPVDPQADAQRLRAVSPSSPVTA